MKVTDLFKPSPRKRKVYIFTESQMRMILNRLKEDLIKDKKLFRSWKT